MKIFVMKPHIVALVALVLHGNEAVDKKNSTELKWCKPVCHISDSAVNQVLSLEHLTYMVKHNIFHT